MDKLAMLGAKASWCLGQWDQMAMYVDLACGSGRVLSVNETDATKSALFCAVLAVHHNHFAKAQHLIDETRRHLDTRLTLRRISNLRVSGI